MRPSRGSLRNPERKSTRKGRNLNFVNFRNRLAWFRSKNDWIFYTIRDYPQGRTFQKDSRLLNHFPPRRNLKPPSLQTRLLHQGLYSKISHSLLMMHGGNYIRIPCY